MKQIHEATEVLKSDIVFWRPSWILLKKLGNVKKITRQSLQGQFAYCKYLEIIRVGVSEWEQKQNEAVAAAAVMAAAAAGGFSKNNKFPPPHSGWRLNKIKNYLIRIFAHLKSVSRWSRVTTSSECADLTKWRWTVYKSCWLILGLNIRLTCVQSDI